MFWKIPEKTPSQNFHKIFKSAQKLNLQVFDSEEITKPRTTSRQVGRDNHATNSVEDYFRVSCFIPSLDNLIEHLKMKFLDNSEFFSSLQVVIPKFASPEKWKKLISLQNYCDNFCTDSRLKAEYEIWCEEISDIDEKQKSDVLFALHRCDEVLFPNIHRFLKVLITIPVTTCTSERSLSTMKRIKNPTRNSTGDERMSELAVLSTHWDIDIDYKDVLDDMCLKNRRLLL